MRIENWENFSLSILLHASLGMLVIVAAFLAPEPKVIAPDRIQITEIDLRNVKITGEETKLINQEIKKQKSDTGNQKSEVQLSNSKPTLTTVKVNRESATLERTLTISVIDALRVSMTRCWQIDQTRSDIKDMRAVAHIQLFPNGRVRDYWFESAPRAETDPAFAYVLDTIKFAIDACNPFSMLPRNEYEKWKSIQLTFYPSAKTVE